MRVMIFVFVLFLAGCAARGTLVWEHTEAHSDRELQQAQQECRQLAQREARFPYFYYHDSPFPFYRPFNYHGRYYGSDLFFNDHFAHIRYQEELSRLYRVCMEAKGWQLVRVQPSTENGDPDSIKAE
ncbi:MAG: hypothetical protein R6V33_08950 [Pelovirga sp.]